MIIKSNSELAEHRHGDEADYKSQFGAVECRRDCIEAPSISRGHDKTAQIHHGMTSWRRSSVSSAPIQTSMQVSHMLIMALPAEAKCTTCLVEERRKRW